MKRKIKSTKPVMAVMAQTEDAQDNAALFKDVWEQLEAMRTITEMSGNLYEAQIQYLKVWPRLAVLSSKSSKCTWNPGTVEEIAKKSDFAAPEKAEKIDDVRCEHTFYEGEKKIRMYRQMCTICRPDLAWPGKLEKTKSEIIFDLISDKRKKEPEGLPHRLQMLGRSVQAMLGKRVKIIVNLDDERIHVQEPG